MDEQLARLTQERDDALARLKSMERVLRAAGERMSDVVREVGQHRNTANRNDQGLYAVIQKMIRGPITEKEVEIWFNDQNFEDVLRDQPIQLYWSGLHSWHQEFVVKAAMHFGNTGIL